MAEASTPMMQQYLRIKREIPPDALLLFRLGDFYEMFYEDAQTGASLLNLTLTKRHGVPMCGVPHHSAQGYIGKLIERGKRVALCEQTSEPKPGQVVERKVTQIFSPGSVAQLEITPPRENCFLAALSPHKERFGFAFIDLTTGDFQLTEIDSEKGLLDEIDRIQPRELLHPTQWNPSLIPETTNIRLTPCDDWIFQGDVPTLTLRDHFQVQSLDGFGCIGMIAAQQAAGGLLHYVSHTLRNDAAQILSLRVYDTSHHLILDATTRANLEIVESPSRAANDTSLLHTLDETITPMGARLLRHWLLHPLRDREELLARQNTVQAFLDDVGRLELFRETASEVRDIERLISRTAAGTANARDLRALADSLRKLPDLSQIALELNQPLALQLAHELKEQPETTALIHQAIVDEPPHAIKEGGIIRPGYHPELDELHTAMREGRTWITELQTREQQRSGIKSLKVRFNQVFGYYIEITKANLDQIPSDYIRKQTMVNAERFITPELKEMESKILGAEERSTKLEYELFLELRDQVAQKTAEIQNASRALAALDALASMAWTARLHNYSKPTLTTNGTLEIINGRHPVLERQMRDERFVPNNTLLDSQNNRLLILTGPNMAGKSTYIRQVALIALMAHTGSFVPAQSATVPMLDRIFTRIGASDDLSRGQSTFMVEMNETANILNNATSNSLIILDEIGRGTSTFDGLSIAWSVAEYIHNAVGAKTLFATHYHELTELAALLPGVKNFNVAVREWQEKIIFLRKIVPGGADKSYGIQVARLAGLPRDVLARAKEILRNLEESELDATGKPALGKTNIQPTSQPKRPRQNPPQPDLFKSFESNDPIST